MENVAFVQKRNSVGLMIWKTIAFILVPLTCVLAGREAIADAASPAFSKDVAPILYKNCLKCHQSGEIGQKIPLTSYDSTKLWVKSIRQKVSAREMPPWPADAADNSVVSFLRRSRENETVVFVVNATPIVRYDYRLGGCGSIEGRWRHACAAEGWTGLAAS